MAKLNKTKAATKKLVEQMLASFAAVQDREFHHKLEVREALRDGITNDKIQQLVILNEDLHQRLRKIEDRLTDNIYPYIKKIQAELSKAKKRKSKSKL